MDLVLKQAAYAEEQPYSRAILITHVIHRGFNMWSILGTGATLAWAGYKRPPLSTLYPTLLAGAARGGIFGLGFGALAVTGRMWGRDLVEWQDRSWRLLGHATQNSTDHWSLVGAAAGAVASGTVYESTAKQLSMGTRLMGGAALGSTLGIVAMLVSRPLLKAPKA